MNNQNEVEIVIVSKEKFDSAPTETKVDAMLKRMKAQGAKGGKDFGDEFSKNSKDAVAKGGRSIGDVLGESMLTGLQRSQSELRKTQAHVADLWKEMEAGSSRNGLAEELVKAEREAKNLSAWVKRLGGDLDGESKKADEAGAKTSFFGRKAGEAGDALSRAFPTGSAFFNPVILGAGAAAAAIALIPAAAITAGVASVGLGLGFIAAAAYAVKGSAIVQGAAKSAASTWTSEIKKAGQGTEQHFVKSLNILEGTASRVGPSLSRSFDKVTPSTVNLARGIDRLAQNAMPGLEDGAEGAAVVLDRFALKLPEVGTLVGDLGTNLKGSADGGATALNTTLGLVIGTVGALGMVLEGSAKTLDFFDKGWGRFTGGSIGMMTGIFGGVDEGQKKVKESAEKAKKETEEWAEKQRELTAAFEASRLVLADYADNLQIASGNALSVSRAQDRVAQSRKDLADGIKKHGAALVGDSTAAMDNREALRKGMEAANEHARALERDGMNQGEAALRREQDITSLRNWAVRQNMNAKEVDNFIRSVNKVPWSKNTKVGAPGAVPSKNQVDAFNKAVGRILPRKGTQTYTNAPNTKAQVEALERAIYSVPTHRTTYFAADIGRAVSNIQRLRALEYAGKASGGITGAANGGARGGLHWVGEEGPELVKLPYGSTVTPNRTSMAMAAAGGGGGTASVVLSMDPGAEGRLVRAILEMLRYEVRNTAGGSVARLLQPPGTV